ncbi:MAG: type II secretion system F family protein, partial [Methanocorpusculum sp.]|nr:type II secretion system F family protein [Methanocorpusculum sp.]
HNMTLARAIQMASEEGKSYIRNEIQMLYRDTEWGTKVSLAIQRFSTRMKLLAVDRMVILISETEHFTNNISNTLFLLYHEAKDSLALANERRSDMSVYVVIVYMAFAVFVFVQVIMVAIFLDIMMDAGSLSASTAAAGGASIGGGFPAELYKIIITHSVLVHGVCSGLVAGKMGEGSIYAGMRHASIMLGLGAITFFVVDLLTG